MIKVIFPPGCYGTFLTKCLYKFTNLNESDDRNFSFDNFGSSHDFRQNKFSKNLISCGHVENLSVDAADKIIVILPCPTHRLDYFDNQFYKHERKHLCNYIHRLYNDVDKIQEKLSVNWNYHNKLDHNTPVWILREWCSFWLEDCLSHGYDVTRYQGFNNAININIQNIFEDLGNTIVMLSKKLELRVLVEMDYITSIQKKFVDAQQLHNIQKKCIAWVDDVLENNDSASPCLTIFDESYVQLLLRKKGYEIQCNELNKFPSNATQLHGLIYHV